MTAGCEWQSGHQSEVAGGRIDEVDRNAADPVGDVGEASGALDGDELRFRAWSGRNGAGVKQRSAADMEHFGSGRAHRDVEVAQKRIDSSAHGRSRRNSVARYRAGRGY